MHYDAAATIEIESSLTSNQQPMPNSHNFRDRLAALPRAICVDRHGEMGRFIFPIVERSIIASTAALADKSGLIVIESIDGWSAIEPDQQIWSAVPGAHYRWSAKICRSEDEFGGADVFWVDYERVSDSRYINDLQGDDGWYVVIKGVNNKISVSFTHETVKTVSHKNA